jgi:hypothetical protein
VFVNAKNQKVELSILIGCALMLENLLPYKKNQSNFFLLLLFNNLPLLLLFITVHNYVFQQNTLPKNFEFERCSSVRPFSQHIAFERCSAFQQH